MIRVRGILQAAAMSAALFAGPATAEASVLDLVKSVCLDEDFPYPRPIEHGADGDRSAALSQGDPEYDQSLPMLPKPPAGWSAEQPRIEVFASQELDCGFRASRVFRKDGKDLVFAVTFAAAVKDMQDELAKEKPALTPPERLLEFKGRRGYDRLATDDRNLVLVVGNMAITINGSATEAEMRALLDAADLDAIENFKL